MDENNDHEADVVDNFEEERRRSQFHQHFARAFFVRKCFAQRFTNNNLAQEYRRKSCS